MGSFARPLPLFAGLFRLAAGRTGRVRSAAGVFGAASLRASLLRSRSVAGGLLGDGLLRDGLLCEGLLCAGLLCVGATGCGSDAPTSPGSADASVGDSSSDASGSGVLTVGVQDGQVVLGWPEDEYAYHCVVLQQQLPGATKMTEVSLCNKDSGRLKIVLGKEPGKDGVDYALSGLGAFKVGAGKWTLKGGNKNWGVTPSVIAQGPITLGPSFSGPCVSPDATFSGLQTWNAKAPVKMDISVQLAAGKAARQTVEICTPEVLVDSVTAQGSSAAGGKMTFSYTFDTAGMYTVEVNNPGGGAILNCAVYVAAAAPLIPVEVTGGAGLQTNPSEAQLAKYRQQLLDLTNAERAKVGAAPLTMQETLHQIAQYHSEDMGKVGYFAHDSPSGEGPGDRAAKFGWTKGIGENIASHGSIEGAHNGLFWSAGHRKNMLAKDWKVVGFGVAKAKDGTNMLVTENFGN